jgi:hypothetical protein
MTEGFVSAFMLSAQRYGQLRMTEKTQFLTAQSIFRPLFACRWSTDGTPVPWFFTPPGYVFIKN